MYEKPKIESLVVDGVELRSEKEMADAFNYYFSNVASELNELLPPPCGDPLENLPTQPVNSFYFFPVNVPEVVGYSKEI